MVKQLSSSLLEPIKSVAMCFACGGGWPWTQPPVQVAAPPVKDEYVYLDSSPAFYPDYRQVREIWSESATATLKEPLPPRLSKAGLRHPPHPSNFRFAPTPSTLSIYHHITNALRKRPVLAKHNITRL